jgi:hypothetical protein
MKTRDRSGALGVYEWIISNMRAYGFGSTDWAQDPMARSCDTVKNFLVPQNMGNALTSLFIASLLRRTGRCRVWVSWIFMSQYEHKKTNMFSLWTALAVLRLIPGFQRSWLRHYATSWKVAGSNPDEVIRFFNWPNPSSRTMALGLTQPLTKMSTRNVPGDKSGRHVRLTNLAPSVSCLENVGASTSHNPMDMALLQG